jgi:lysozyme
MNSIDLSHQNSEFDWSKLRKDIGIVILKSTQGATFKDATFISHFNKVRSSSLILGAYHFLNFTDTAESQANNFLSRNINFSHPNTLPPIVDIENQVGRTNAESALLDGHIYKNPKDSEKLIHDYLTIIEEKTGRKPIIYTYKGFWLPTLRSPDFSNYPLWVANYSLTPPHQFGGWKDWTLWQFSENSSATGIGAGDVDMSRVNPNIDLNKLANITKIG